MRRKRRRKVVNNISIFHSIVNEVSDFGNYFGPSDYERSTADKLSQLFLHASLLTEGRGAEGGQGSKYSRKVQSGKTDVRNTNDLISTFNRMQMSYNFAEIYWRDHRETDRFIPPIKAKKFRKLLTGEYNSLAERWEFQR